MIVVSLVAQKFTCFSAITGGKVDREAGVIRGVSVITEGDAKGHGFKIDSESITSLFKLAKGFTNGVLVKFKHKKDGEFQNILTETAGSLTNFSIADNKLKADFVPLESLAEQVKETLYELCEKFYDQFGFSPTANITFEEKESGKFARFTNLQSVDLTNEPAANLSLFSAACEFCGNSGCTTDHDETELSTAYSHADAAKRLSIESYATKNNKKLSKPTTMSAITQEAFDALTAKVVALTTALEAKTTATSIVFTGDDGKTVTLSARDVHTQLATANRLVKESGDAAEKAERSVVLSRMEAEGRVAMNPDTNVAYTRVELEAKPIGELKFMAANSARIPLEARAVFRGEKLKTIDPKITGAARIALSIENSLGTTAAEMVHNLSRGAGVVA